MQFFHWRNLNKTSLPPNAQLTTPALELLILAPKMLGPYGAKPILILQLYTCTRTHNRRFRVALRRIRVYQSVP